MIADSNIKGTILSRIPSKPASTRPAVIKIQTVRSYPIEYGPDLNRTIGQEVDFLLAEHAKAGYIPNKLVLDLNPKPEPNPADIDA